MEHIIITFVIRERTHTHTLSHLPSFYAPASLQSFLVAVALVFVMMVAVAAVRHKLRPWDLSYVAVDLGVDDTQFVHFAVSSFAVQDFALTFVAVLTSMSHRHRQNYMDHPWVDRTSVAY